MSLIDLTDAVNGQALWGGDWGPIAVVMAMEFSPLSAQLCLYGPWDAEFWDPTGWVRLVKAICWIIHAGCVLVCVLTRPAPLRGEHRRSVLHRRF